MNDYVWGGQFDTAYEPGEYVTYEQYSGVPNMKVEDALEGGLLAKIFEGVREELIDAPMFASPEGGFFAKIDRVLNRNAQPHKLPSKPEDIVAIIQRARPDFEGAVSPHTLTQAVMVQDVVAKHLKQRTGVAHNLI